MINSFLLLIQLILFHSTTEITLSQQNVSLYLYLSEVLDNISLLLKCSKVTSNQSQIFKLSSHNLIYLSQKRKSIFNKLTLKVNGQNFTINSSFFSFISDFYLNNSDHLSQQEFSLSQKEFSCFLSFGNIFKRRRILYSTI